MLSLSRSSAVALLGAIFLSTPLQAATVSPSTPIFGYNHNITVKATNCYFGGTGGPDCLPRPISTTGFCGYQATSNSYGLAQTFLSQAPIMKGVSESGISGGVHPVGNSARSEVSSLLSYGFQINGATGAPVRVRMKAAMEIEVIGGPSNSARTEARARMVMGRALVPDVLFEQVLQTELSGMNAPTSRKQDYSFDMWFNMIAGNPYAVYMQYSLFTSASFSSTSYHRTGIYRATAMLDPYFEIHPDDVAKGFSLSFSEGINNVPITPEEPETPAPVPLPAAGFLLGAALLGLGATRRQAA